MVTKAVGLVAKAVSLAGNSTLQEAMVLSRYALSLSYPCRQLYHSESQVESQEAPQQGFQRSCRYLSLGLLVVQAEKSPSSPGQSSHQSGDSHLSARVPVASPSSSPYLAPRPHPQAWPRSAVSEQV